MNSVNPLLPSARYSVRVYHTTEASVTSGSTELLFLVPRLPTVLFAFRNLDLKLFAMILLCFDHVF